MRVRIPINGGRRIPKRKKLDRLESAQPTRNPPPPIPLPPPVFTDRFVRSPPQPEGNRRSSRVRGRRHGRAAEAGPREGSGGGTAGHCRSMELDAREKEVAEALDLFKSRRDFEAEKESIERKLRELREREEELEMLGNYIEERRVRVRANEVEVEKKKKATKAKEKEIKRKSDDLKHREEEFGKRLGKLIVREKRIKKLESRVHDYEQRLSRLEMEGNKEPQVTLELQGMEFEIVQGFGDDFREKASGRKGKKRSKETEKEQKDESSSQQNEKGKEWFDAFSRGLVETGQKKRNGDAVDRIHEMECNDVIDLEKGHVNSADDGLLKEDNRAHEDKEMECNDVIDLDSLKPKKVMDRVQSSLEEQHKKRSADSVAELIKKISERNEDKWAECNAVINSIMTELSAQEKAATKASKKCSENLDSAQDQADIVPINGEVSIAATGSSIQENLGETVLLENQIQERNGKVDLQREQLHVPVEENEGLTEKESGSAQVVSSCDAPAEKSLVDSVADGLVKETSEGPIDKGPECNAVNKSASLNAEQPKKCIVDSFAEFITNSEENQDIDTERSSAVIKPSIVTECSANEKEPEPIKSSSTMLHLKEMQLYTARGSELGPAPATRSSSPQAAQPDPQEEMTETSSLENRIEDGNGELNLQREQLDLVVEESLEALGCAQERSDPTPDSQLQVKKEKLDELKKGRTTRIYQLQSLVNEQQECSVDTVAAELIRETSGGINDKRTICGSTVINPIIVTECSAKGKEPESISSKLNSLGKQFDEMYLDENQVQDGNVKQLHLQREKLDDVVVENPGGVQEKESLGYPDTRLVSGRQLLKRFELKRKQEQFTSLSDYTKFCFSSLNRIEEDVDSEKFLYWARSKPGKRMRKGQVDPGDLLASAGKNNGDKGTTENVKEKEKEPDSSITQSSLENPHSCKKQQLESTTLQYSTEAQKQSDGHLEPVDELNKSSNSDGPGDKVMEEKEPSLSDKCASATKPLLEEKHLDAGKDNGVQQTTATAPANAPFSKRYESQKKRDWGTFLFYYSKILKHPASSSVPLCTGADVIAYMKHMDQFGKTKVHIAGCANYGSQEKGTSCDCPLKQAWGSQDSLIGRLRAACEECGVDPKANPFASKEVRFYLKGMKEEQDKARGTSFMKKRKRKKPQVTTEAQSSEPSANLPEAGGVETASLPEAGGPAAAMDNSKAVDAVGSPTA